MVARQFGAKREARKTVRRLVDLDCDVYADLWGEALPHRVTDVSETGLWVQTDLLLEVGTEVTLTFVPPDWDEPLCVAGRVRRVELRPRPSDGGAVGMGIAFETLRNDERRRLTHSMRCLRAQEAYILDQRTLTGVPVAVDETPDPAPVAGGTLAGWYAPPRSVDPPGRASRITTAPADRPDRREPPSGAFCGGLELAASVFASDSSD